ncbi:lysostaphin resistance A-like protein [Butyrivibrio sp. JL13D10]|uniref:CPBP family intramembrane glutamic endopeptidase n=1 Tax=Butyrivibrio sp. JL13D10 TaxID=3236815 RepID=UPI0038B44CC4
MKTTKGSKAKAIFAALGIILLVLGIQAVIGAICSAGATYVHFVQTGEAFADQAEYMEYISGILTVAQFLGEIACIVVFGLWYFLGYVRKDKKQGTYESGLKKVANVKTIAFLTFASLGIYAFDLLIVKATEILIPGSKELYSQIMGAVTGGNPIIAIITVALLAPFAEELALRAVMLKNSKKAFGMVGCVILTALMFGLMHMNPMQSLYAIPMGLLLGFVAYKYNSVVPAIIVHIINNTCSMLIPSLMGRALSAIEAAIVFVVFFALAVFTYKKLSVRNEQIEKTEVAA